MQTKLTLRMDDALIRAAKAQAARQRVSLSELVADFFEHFTQAREDQLTPWTRSLVGVAASRQGDTPGDDRVIREVELDRAATKHA